MSQTRVFVFNSMFRSFLYKTSSGGQTRRIIKEVILDSTVFRGLAMGGDLLVIGVLAVNVLNEKITL